MPAEIATDDREVHSAMVMLSRMGERVAGLEARLEGLKGDTENTRQAIHAINSEVQKIFISEERCFSSLTALSTEVAKLVQAAPIIAAAISTFEGMRIDLRAVIEARHRIDGERTAGERMLVLSRSFLPWLVALGAMSAWGWEHLNYHS